MRILTVSHKADLAAVPFKRFLENKVSNIALLLFTRTPEEEVRYKNLLPQATQTKKIAVAQKLIQRSQAVLAATNLPFYIYTTANQRGNTFGEKLYHAFADLFALGYQQVIAIGNDCPQLKPTDILEAAHTLQEQEVVLGPDLKGGVYLLGLTRHAFQECSSFNTIRWQTAWVVTDMAALFKQDTAKITILGTYQDINNAKDFQKSIRQKLFSSPLLRFFRLLLGYYETYTSKAVVNFISRQYFPALSFRGPPVF